MNYLIICLGNIGKHYELNRHNVGFMVADYIFTRKNLKPVKDKYGIVSSFRQDDVSVHVVKPTTLMNLSGKAATYYLQKLKLKAENVLVIVDDLAFDFGVLKLKTQGGAGGHNGLASIQQALNTADYARLRIGIGRDFSPGCQAEYVLSDFTLEEQNTMPQVIEQAYEIIKDVFRCGINQAMTKHNRR